MNMRFHFTGENKHGLSKNDIVRSNCAEPLQDGQLSVSIINLETGLPDGTHIVHGSDLILTTTKPALSSEAHIPDASQHSAPAETEALRQGLE